MNQAIVDALADARRAGTKLSAYPGPKPRDKDEAFAIQTAARKKLGWRICGWKIGCTSERAQKMLGTDGPFPGPVYRERMFRSGDHVPTHETNVLTIEPEIAFTMARELPARGKAYGVEEVLSAIASVHASIEVVNPRLPNGFADPVEWYIADGALNDALVLGNAVKPLPRGAYSAIANEAFVNGASVGKGVGANALGGPELALTWLANDLIAKGEQLREGDVISTGIITDIFFGKHGDKVRAVYTELGEIEAVF
jgi:2-keto-4-pentenoate hydratase